jgi:hypothetical protein
MRWMVIVIVLVISQIAHAEPVLLACYGEIRNARSEQTEKYALPVRIDLQAGTVRVENYEAVPFMGPPEDDTVAFIAKPETKIGVSTGSINRITGQASIHIIRNDGLLIFEGNCRRAEKLF